MTDANLETEAKIECPYCSQAFPTILPDLEYFPKEIFAVPYTRDVGRFDPEDKSEWFLKEKWTKIGADFFSTFGWEKIGILRVSDQDLIYYRVQGCPNCENLFDVYLNYSPGKKFSEVWPHLFTVKNDFQGEYIKKYEGMSILIWIIRSIGKVVRSNNFAIAILASLLFCLGYFSQQVASESGAGVLALYAIASLGAAIIMGIIDRFVKFLNEGERLFGFLDVKQPRIGLSHWRNFTLARVVGVQEAGKVPSLSQVDLLGGLLSTFLFSVIWFTINLSINLILSIAINLVILILLSIFGQILKKWEESSQLVGITKFLLSVILGFGMVWIVTFTFSSDLLTSLHYLGDYVFWFLITYFLGVGAWLGLNTSFYIIKGIQKIPLKTTFQNRDLAIKPIKMLERFSILIILAIFICLIALIGIVETLVPLVWLEIWTKVAIAFVFGGIGVAMGYGDYLGVSLVYLALEVLFWQKSPDFLNGPLNIDILISGAFFSILVAIQVFRLSNLTGEIESRGRNMMVSYIDRRLVQVKTSIDGVISRIERSDKGVDAEGVLNLQYQKKSLQDEFESIIVSSKPLLAEAGSKNIMVKIFEIGIPFVFSIVLSIVLEKIMAGIIGDLFPFIN